MKTEYEIIETLREQFGNDKAKVLYDLFTYRNSEILATKEDLHTLEAKLSDRITSVETRLTERISQVESGLSVRFAAALIAQTALLFGLIRFFT